MILILMILALIIPQTVHRDIVIVYVEPVGETLTDDEKLTAYQNVVQSAEYWTTQSPITTTIDIVGTMTITASDTVFDNLGGITTLANVTPIYIIDNSNSGKYLIGQYLGLSNAYELYVLTTSSPAVYAHEFGHNLYNLPHQFQSSLDIMGLDPTVAWQHHFIGCDSLAVLGKSCTRVYLPIIIPAR